MAKGAKSDKATLPKTEESEPCRASGARSSLVFFEAEKQLGDSPKGQKEPLIGSLLPRWPAMAPAARRVASGESASTDMASAAVA